MQNVGIFLAFSNILWQFVVIWYNFFPVLVGCIKKNLATPTGDHEDRLQW
jgi:hypothetical protein